MKKFSDLSLKILKSNNINDDKLKNFIKELRLTLRLDFGLKALDIRKMNDNIIIETWYKINSLPENLIKGSNE